MAHGEVRALLTGDHYGADDGYSASVATEKDVKAAMLEKRSPMYLVPDSVVRMAMDVRMRCDEGGDEAFTRVVLGGLLLPLSDLTGRIDKSVISTIGMTTMDAHWCEAMTDNEIDRVFKELGVFRAENRKGE